MRDSIATDNVWYDETSNPNWCQSRIWGDLHPLGEVINGNQDELMTTGRLRWNLPNDVYTLYWKMVMVKSVHVTLKVAREWGPHVSSTLDISKQTGNNLSP